MKEVKESMKESSRWEWEHEGVFEYCNLHRFPITFLAFMTGIPASMSPDSPKGRKFLSSEVPFAYAATFS